MKWSPADMTLQWTPNIVRYSRSNGARSAKVYAVLRPIARQLILSKRVIFSPNRSHFGGSRACEVFLDQRAKLRRDFGPLSEPQLKAAHRLVQQHAEAIGGLQST